MITVNLENQKYISRKSIELVDVSFKYNNDHDLVLSDINLKISKGDFVGIFGETGSGKSTLLDILLGLIEPTSGKVYIDGDEIKIIDNEYWHRLISHVPQKVFLSDTSLINNIITDANSIPYDEKKSA